MPEVAVEEVSGYVERIGDKGYGFIMTNDKRRVFFHVRNVRNGKSQQLPRPGSIVTACISPSVQSGRNHTAVWVDVVNARP